MAKMNHRIRQAEKRLERIRERLSETENDTITLNKNGTRLFDTPKSIAIDTDTSAALHDLCEEHAKEMLLSVCDALGIDPSCQVIESGDVDFEQRLIRCSIDWFASFGVHIEGDLP